MSNATEENVLPFPHLIEEDDDGSDTDTLRLVRMIEAMIFASSEPVASFLYLAIKGTVAPSSMSFRVAITF